MSDSNEPSCWRVAALSFGLIAGLMLVVALIGGGGEATAVAVR